VRRSPKLEVPASKGRKRVVAGHTPPPVLVRGVWTASPVQPQERPKPRRRFDVSLNVPGAEVRLPALPTVRVGWRLASGLLTLLILALLAHLWSSPRYRVTEIEFAGLQRLTGTDVSTVLAIGGEPIFAVNASQIRQELKRAFPEFKAVSVKIGLPAKVAISVDERQPVIAWQQNGRVVWVDAEGVAFPPRGEPGALVPVNAQSAPPTRPGLAQDVALLDPEMVVTLQGMAARAPEGAMILYDAKHGLGWIDARGWFAYFGTNFDDMDMKLTVYQALADQLEQQGIRPAMVSVEHVHAPYYRLER
jgi:cell division protein FtsQ